MKKNNDELNREIDRLARAGSLSILRQLQLSTADQQNVSVTINSTSLPDSAKTRQPKFERHSTTLNSSLRLRGDVVELGIQIESTQAMDISETLHLFHQ